MSYYFENRLSRIDYQKQYHERNKEKFREYQRAYFQKNYIKKEERFGWDMAPYKLKKIETLLRKKLKELNDSGYVSIDYKSNRLQRVIRAPEPFSGIETTKEGLFRLVPL
jgi:hypothetical protein